ncbi:MAG: type II secretion system protein [Candidatus Cloacimonetes bacterium]|nr:type II secretion system protein [Candidatus Cloacimonadota bacterium]
MADNLQIEKRSKFSLIELLMIIMLVGILFTLIVPLRNDRIRKARLGEAIRNIQIIARANVAFRDDPDKGDGSYMFEHTVVKYNEPYRDSLNHLVPASLKGEDLLNIADELQKEKDFFYFDYFLTDSTVVATTNSNFGKKGASIYYYLPTGPWGVSDNDISRSVIDPNWLP